MACPAEAGGRALGGAGQGTGQAWGHRTPRPGLRGLRPAQRARTPRGCSPPRPRVTGP